MLLSERTFSRLRVHSYLSSASIASPGRLRLLLMSLPSLQDDLIVALSSSSGGQIACAAMGWEWDAM